MKLIHKADAGFIKFLEPYKATSALHKPLRCLVTEPVSGGILLLNMLTNELLFLSDEERANFSSTSYAAEHWFVAPEGTDENALVRDYREYVTKSHKPGYAPYRQWLIYTTTCCNARCPYCYEIGHHQNITMTDTTAEKAADYVLQNTPERQKPLLAWMGGEPLLNTRAIDTICRRIRASGRDYTSSIATNGYLFNEELIEKAVSLWKLSIVQITIDGLEDEYNATKRYTDPSAKTHSPFHRILQNIGLLLAAGIKAEIHLHITEHNGDDIISLIYLLLSKFGIRKNLTVKVMPYFQRVFDELHRRSPEAEERILDKQIEALELCRKSGYWNPSLAKTCKIFHCTPDRGEQFTILPDGHVGWCDQVIDRDFLGTVDSSSIDEAVIKKYKERMPELPECAECSIFPNCIRLNCCNNDVMWCSSEIRGWKNYVLRAQLRATYEQYVRSAKA